MRPLLLALLLAGCHPHPYPPIDSGPTDYTGGTVDTGSGGGGGVAVVCEESVACGDCYSGQASCSVFDCYGNVTSSYTAECECPTNEYCDSCADDGYQLCHVVDCSGYEVDGYYVSC